MSPFGCCWTTAVRSVSIHLLQPKHWRSQRLLPYAIVLAKGELRVVGRGQEGPHLVLATQLHVQLAHVPGDLRHVQGALRALDAHVAASGDAVALARVNERRDLGLKQPVEKVHPEYAWDSGMCEDVGVAHAQVLLGERPVVLRAARVVVVNEGARSAGPPSTHTRHLVAIVSQPPELSLHRLLQHRLGGEVERRRQSLCGVHPVAECLAMGVLVRLQAFWAVLARVPDLRDTEGFGPHRL
mmetsp:Transcript_5782/g.10922  ORF Transcript_5782/g.10922 Transcript_5782/m.10922 type:complete len:241 (-) Transcript_5782:1254-1976(-)